MTFRILDQRIFQMHPNEIGPYRITRKVGSGGMGNVYHGIHMESEQEVAVKVLPASMTRESGFVRRFSREIEAMRQLNNPHIVRLFEDGQAEDGSYFYSMEFVDGETLTSLVSRRRKLPWDDVIDLSKQIATALKAAHDAGIIHRDLKPSNLMVSSSGELKLTDFGVADIFAGTRLTRPGGVVGTAEYMSPEQARGRRATKHSDLYSLGAVMYVMLAGRPPFTGKMASDIMQQHQVAQFDLPSHYAPATPRLLEELVCRLLQKKPDDRLPDALVVLRQLDNIKGRIEFSQKTSDQTRVVSKEQTSAGQSVTDQTRVDGENVRGPATLVRDIMREEINESSRKTPVGAFFDNTYVLIALLAGIVFLGFYLVRETKSSPEEQLAEARRMIDKDAGGQWVRAKKDLLLPLLKSDSLPDAEAEIQRLLKKVDDYEFCRSLQPAFVRDDTQSEIHRLIQEAFRLHASGEQADGQKQLEAVQLLLKDGKQSKYLESFVNTSIEEWNQSSNDEQKVAYFRSVLNEIRQDAQSLAEQSRLKALISLYEDDPSMKAEVSNAKQLLPLTP